MLSFSQLTRSTSCVKCATLYHTTQTAKSKCTFSHSLSIQLRVMLTASLLCPMIGCTQQAWHELGPRNLHASSCVSSCGADGRTFTSFHDSSSHLLSSPLLSETPWRSDDANGRLHKSLQPTSQRLSALVYLARSNSQEREQERGHLLHWCTTVKTPISRMI